MKSKRSGGSRNSPARESGAPGWVVRSFASESREAGVVPQPQPAEPAAQRSDLTHSFGRLDPGLAVNEHGSQVAQRVLSLAPTASDPLRKGGPGAESSKSLTAGRVPLQLLKLVKTSGSEINLDDATQATSREASLGVYITGKKVYKVFGSRTKAEGEFQATADVDVDYGVPIATPIDWFEADLVDNSSTKRGYVFEANKVSGTFFQLSKNTALQKFVEETDDMTALSWALRGLKAAKEAQLTDPQGFIDPNELHPITFIDIHTGSSPHVVIMELIETAKSRLEE